MRLKKIIYISFAAIVVISLIILVDLYCIYPVHYNLPRMGGEYNIYSYSSKISRVLKRLSENRTTGKELIFWDTPVRFGMTKSELIEMHPSTSKIYYGEKVLDVRIIYDCTYEKEDAALENIYMRIPYDLSVENELISYYGQKYIRSPKYYRGYERTFNLWLLEDGYVVLEKPSYLEEEKYLYIGIGVFEQHYCYYKSANGWKHKAVHGVYVQKFDEEDGYVDDVAKKDSVDILIEQRKTQEFNSSIFAGLYFGDYVDDVEWVLGDDDCREILVPNGDNVAVVNIATYDAEYYEGGLASLVLYAEEDELIDGLETVYSTKYGKTKDRKWLFANCSVEIKYGGRKEYDPSKEAGYGRSSGPMLYHDSFRGYRVPQITKDGTFLKIEYKNYELMRLMEREQQIADSLENVRGLEAAKAQKDLAMRLATEIATGI